MSTATLRMHYRAIQNKVTSIQAIKINWKLLYFLAFMCSLAMLVFYVFGVNQLIQGTYLIKNYNKEIKNLLAENRSLEVVGTEASFLGLTQAKAQELSFQKSTDITYVHVLESSLAKAK